MKDVISIHRLPWKTKTGEDPWYFNNSLLCKPDFSLATKNLLSLLKIQKITTLWQKTSGNILNLVLKRTLEHVLKIQSLKEILEFQDWKRGYEIDMKIKEKFKPEIKPIIKIYKMNFTN